MNINQSPYDKIAFLMLLQGNEDYARYWSHVERNKELHVVPDVNEGIKELESGKTILHGQSGILKVAVQQNPSLQENLKVFGTSKPTYMCLMFNENSPLVPLFSKASIETFESGQYDHVSTKWLGQDITYEEKVTADVLGPGQVFMIFIFLIAMLACSFACLIFECIYFYFLKKKLLSRLPPQAIPTIQPEPSREMAPVDSNG